MPGLSLHLRRPWFRVSLATVAVAWGTNEFTPLLPMYREVAGLSATTVYLLLGVYVFGIIPALLIGGPLSDRFGRRSLMVPAPFVCALASAFLGLGAHSVPMLLTGRLLTGISLGMAMAAGAAWLKELSQPPFEPLRVGLGARRAGMSLTAGFLLGAVVAAALAEWGPWPTLTPYVVNIVLSLATGVMLLSAPETAPQALAARRRRDDAVVPDVQVDASRPDDGANDDATPARTRIVAALRIPSAREPRFLLVVLPAAFWVFGVNALSFATLPGVLAEQISGAPVAFAGLMTLVTLGAGFVTQQFAGRVQKAGSARGLVVALSCAIVGLSLAAATSFTHSLPLALVTGASLGTAFGFLLLGGLREVQLIAGPDDLAGLTGVFYSVAYLGFFLPMILAMASGAVSYPALFAILAALALVGLLVVARFGRLQPGRPAP